MFQEFWIDVSSSFEEDSGVRAGLSILVEILITVFVD